MLGFLPNSFTNATNGNTNAATAGINVTPFLISNQFVSIIGLTLLTIALIYSLRVEKITGKQKSYPRFIPKIILYLFFSFIAFGIGL